MKIEDSKKLVEEYGKLESQYCFLKVEQREKNKKKQLNAFVIDTVIKFIICPIVALIGSCYYKNIVFIKASFFMNVITLGKVYKDYKTIIYGYNVSEKYKNMLQNYGQIVCDYLDSFTFVDYAINCHYVVYPAYDEVKNFVTNLGFTTNYEKNKKEIIPFLYKVLEHLYEYEKIREKRDYNKMFQLENFPTNTLEKKMNFFKGTRSNSDMTNKDIEEWSASEKKEYVKKAIKFRQEIIQKLSFYTRKHRLGGGFALHSKYFLHIFEVYNDHGFFIDKKITMHEIENEFLKKLNLPLDKIFHKGQESESLPVILHAPFFIIHFWPNLCNYSHAERISNPIFCKPLRECLEALNINSDFLQNIDIPEGKKGTIYKRILYDMVCAKDTLCSNSVIYFKDCTSLFINNFLGILQNKTLQKDEIITILKIFLYGYIIKNNVGKERSMNKHEFQKCEPYIDKTEKELEEIKILIKNILPGFEHIYFYCKENKSIIFHKSVYALLYLLEKLKGNGIEESWILPIMNSMDKKYQLSFHDIEAFLNKKILPLKKNILFFIVLSRVDKFQCDLESKLFK